MICFSVVLWPITCCLTFSAFFAIGAIHSPKVPRSGSENQCSHQDNLCPWSYYIYVGAKAVEFKASTCHCYLLFYWNHQPLAHPYLHSGIYVWIHKDWTIDQLVTDVFPTLKHCYLFSTSLLPLTTLLNLAYYRWDFFPPEVLSVTYFIFITTGVWWNPASPQQHGEGGGGDSGVVCCPSVLPLRLSKELQVGKIEKK